MTVSQSDKEASDAEISSLKDALRKTEERSAADKASDKALHGQAAGCIESLEAKLEAANARADNADARAERAEGALALSEIKLADTEKQLQVSEERNERQAVVITTQSVKLVTVTAERDDAVFGGLEKDTTIRTQAHQLDMNTIVSVDIRVPSQLVLTYSL